MALELHIMTPSALAEAIAVEAGLHPQGGVVPLLPGSTLLIDGDGLAYSTAGNDSTSPGQARNNLIERVHAATRRVGADHTNILTTAPGSNKGYRFALARAKPYQGQRKGSHRPKNWQVLREVLESGSVPGANVELTWHSEADDLFAYHSDSLGADKVVIHTEDKDMRMVPGWHLTWDTLEMVYVEPGTWVQQFNGKTYGRRWFWEQMLAGDNVDNIPGVPGWHVIDGKKTRLGPVTATSLMGMADNDVDAFHIAGDLYHSQYKDAWAVEMLEQATLLWMRRGKFANPFDVLAEGGPLAHQSGEPDFIEARRLLQNRILDSRTPSVA